MAASDEVQKSWRLAQQLRAPWEDRWQRLIDVAMPYRTHITAGSPETRHGQNTGQIYDETGVTAIEEFASRLLSGIVPDGVDWARLEVSAPAAEKQPDLPPQVLHMQRTLFTELTRCNFAPEMFDGFKDLAGFGNICVRILPGDWSQPLVFEAVSMADVWVTPGKLGRHKDLHVRHWMTPDAILAEYPAAVLPDEVKASQKLVAVIDSWLLDLKAPTPAWRNEVHIDCKLVLAQAEARGRGGCPYVFGRWSKASGELYGVGQGMLALPAIEVLNDAMRLILAHGEMALSGMWQAEDDGVLNPWGVQLAPGSIIPIAQGSRGLMPLQLPQTRLDIGQIVLEEQRHAIRKALFNETMGKREGTPPTALEVQERMAELARQIGPAYGRVWHEVILGVLYRTMRVLTDQGRIAPVEVDGKTVRLVAASSLVRSARVGEVRRMNEWAAGVVQTFGPAALQTKVDADKWMARTAELMDVDDDLLYSPEQVKMNARKAGEVAGQLGEATGANPMETIAPLLASMGGGGR